MDILKTKRRGKLIISLEVAYAFWEYAAGLIIPVKVEYNICTRNFEVDAVSDAFRELNDGDAIPTYALNVKTIGEITVLNSIEEV